jgi:hypothetical protein
MCFTSWSDFTEEFMLMFCPENEATIALMWLESDHYYQGKWNVEVYIDEFKDLIDLSGYTDPIAIVLTFCRGLNSMTQDRIIRSGMDRLSDIDFNGWFKAAWHLDLNRLVNEAFHLASRCPSTHSAPMTYPAPHAHHSHFSTHMPPPPCLQQCTPLRAHFPLASLWMLTALRPSNPLCKPTTAVARPVTSVKIATFGMTSAI